MKQKNNEVPVESLSTYERTFDTSRSPKSFSSPFIARLQSRMEQKTKDNVVKKLDFDKLDLSIVQQLSQHQFQTQERIVNKAKALNTKYHGWLSHREQKARQASNERNQRDKETGDISMQRNSYFESPRSTMSIRTMNSIMMNTPRSPQRKLSPQQTSKLISRLYPDKNSQQNQHSPRTPKRRKISPPFRSPQQSYRTQRSPQPSIPSSCTPRSSIARHRIASPNSSSLKSHVSLTNLREKSVANLTGVQIDNMVDELYSSRVTSRECSRVNTARHNKTNSRDSRGMDYEEIDDLLLSAKAHSSPAPLKKVKAKVRLLLNRVSNKR